MTGDAGKIRLLRKYYRMKRKGQTALLQLMLRFHLNDQLPAVENGRLVGMVSYTDITWGLLARYYKGSFHRRA